MSDHKPPCAGLPKNKTRRKNKIVFGYWFWMVFPIFWNGHIKNIFLKLNIFRGTNKENTFFSPQELQHTKK